jgi:hypothetical protein
MELRCIDTNEAMVNCNTCTVMNMNTDIEFNPKAEVLC